MDPPRATASLRDVGCVSPPHMGESECQREHPGLLEWDREKMVCAAGRNVPGWQREAGVEEGWIQKCSGKWPLVRPWEQRQAQPRWVQPG